MPLLMHMFEWHPTGCALRELFCVRTPDALSTSSTSHWMLGSFLPWNPGTDLGVRRPSPSPWSSRGAEGLQAKIHLPSPWACLQRRARGGARGRWTRDCLCGEGRMWRSRCERGSVEETSLWREIPMSHTRSASGFRTSWTRNK